MQAKKRLSAIPYIMVVLGVMLHWGGMIYALGNSAVFHPIGIVISLSGLIMIALSYWVKINTENENEDDLD